MKKALCVVGLGVVLLAGISSNAWASAVIMSGPVTLGVNDFGNLGAPNGAGVSFGNGPFALIGLALAGVGDAIAPGCFCEGWGVGSTGSGDQGGADISVGGVSNLTFETFVSSPITATSTVHLTSLPDLQVTQDYAPSAGAPATLFEDVVTIKNLGDTDPITGIQYRRVMDWDIPPTEFDEFVTLQGLPAANVIFTNDNGFDFPKPFDGTGGDLAGCGTTVNFTDCGPHDHGAHFDFSFGDLGPGDSKTFSIFYGAAYSEADALAALGAVGAEVYSLGESNTPGGPEFGTPGTYIFGFKGVGGTPIGTPVIPEPTSLFLLGSGMVGMAWAGRKRSSL